MDARLNFTRDRTSCSLSDGEIAKIFAILHPGCQAESIADLNLGFGFAYYAFARILRPKLVVVFGSMIGFSPVCFALGVKDNANDGRVVLVDAGYSDQADGKAKGFGGIGFWKESSKYNALFKEFDVEDIIDVKLMKTSEFAECYKKDVMPPIDLLMIDADHSFEGFKFDLETFSRFVRDDGLILCHDTMVEYGRWGYPCGIKKYFEDVIEKCGEYEYVTLNFGNGLGIIKRSRRAINRYVPDSIVHFGIGGNEEKYLTQGWSYPEEGFRWTNGRTAVFECYLPRPKTDLILKMTITPFLGNDHRKCQRISILMNDHKLEDVLHVSHTLNLDIKIPYDYFEEEVQRITFDIPDAISPNDLGISADGRTLGIAVRMLSMNYRSYGVHPAKLLNSLSASTLGGKCMKWMRRRLRTSSPSFPAGNLSSNSR